MFRAMYWYLLIFVINGLVKTVILTNQIPIFTTPTSPINLAENENGQLLLYTLTVSDPDGDPITCSLQSTSPNTLDFGVWYNSSDFGMYVLAGSTLDYSSTPVYTMTVECSDDTGSASMNITVNVLPNSPPTFTNLPATQTNVNVNSVNLGDVLYTVTATDTDSTSLTYSMTSLPVSPAMFAIDPVSGKVTATQDLIYAVDNAYDLTITVSDSKDTTTSNLILKLKRVNTAPIINNLPATINVQESTSGNTVLFTLSITEPDTSDTTDITYVVSPSGYTSKFNMNNNDVRLTNNDRFNYEIQSTYTVTFTVSDGKASNGNYVLSINVVDVNEACTFEYSIYHITLQEANVGGSTADPGFRVTDEDTGSSFTYSLQNVVSASLFTIDPVSGVVSFAVNYDVDSIHPNSTNFRAYCTDNYGATGQTTLYVTVEDVNDNAPTFGATSSIIYFDQTMIIPHTVTTLSATDADSGDNALLHYTWTTTGSGGTYFTLSPSGVILLTADPQSSLNYGASFRFVVIAVDSGTPALSGTTTLDLIYQEVNATTAVTTTGSLLPETSDSSFWDKPGNIAVLALGIILGSIACGITAYAVKKYLEKKRLSRVKTRKVEPGKEQHPQPEKEIFDFWKPARLLQDTYSKPSSDDTEST